ncbi:MAG: sugar ABC transporter substrate-binding protein [Thalassotalea sp.]|nr:sugar ABC transporter substrate-binding protein [Thalassotalea sp.]
MKLLNYILSAFMILTLIGCSPANNQNGEILLLLKTLDNPFFLEIKEGVKTEMDNKNLQYKLTVKAGAFEKDIETQRRVLESYISAKKNVLKGVIITPSGSQNELVRQIKKLNNLNIPVILVDTDIDIESLNDVGAYYDYYVGSDNLYGGKLAGEYLSKFLSQESKVLILNGPNNHETAMKRRNGFVNSIEELQIQLIERTANWREDEARKLVSSLISAGKNVDAIFAANDNMALGAIEAYRTIGRDEPIPVIVGFDAIDKAVEAIDSGKLAASIKQRPFTMGEKAVQLMFGNKAEGNNSREMVKLEVVSKDR